MEDDHCSCFLQERGTKYLAVVHSGAVNSPFGHLNRLDRDVRPVKEGYTQLFVIKAAQFVLYKSDGFIGGV